MAERVLFKDVVPYDTPFSLSALRGPASGVIELPLAIYWGPRRLYDLSDCHDLRSAYQALVRQDDAHRSDRRAQPHRPPRRARHAPLLRRALG